MTWTPPRFSVLMALIGTGMVTIHCSDGTNGASNDISGKSQNTTLDGGGDSGDSGGDAGPRDGGACAKRSYTMTVTSKSYIGPMASGGGYGSCPRPSTYPGGTCGGCSSLAVQAAWFSGFAWITDASYNEDPQKNSGSNNYRIGATATMTWECDGGAVTNARLQSSSSGGGQELPTYYGVSHFADAPSSGPNGGTSVPLPAGRYDYLEWGFPNTDLEPPFQQIATRSNSSIFHKVRAYMFCEPNNQGRLNVSMAGTPFPSHRLWVDASETTGNAANPVGNFGPAQITQGKFELLWYLPQVPQVTELPSNIYPFVSFYPELQATADPTVAEIAKAVPAPTIPPAACTPPQPPPSCSNPDRYSRFQWPRVVADNAQLGMSWTGGPQPVNWQDYCDGKLPQYPCLPGKTGKNCNEGVGLTWCTPGNVCKAGPMGGSPAQCSCQ